MATYVIGDLQGCYDELMSLLKQIHYQAEKDELWFAGDIVNRGPKSLECLRFVKSLGPKGKMVLGNHDFHLLSAFSGIDKHKNKTDTLHPILNAKDSKELIDWLRHQPLIVRHQKLPIIMVHAGIPPQWKIDEAIQYSQEIEKFLQGRNWKSAIRKHLYGNAPTKWSKSLKGWDKKRYIINALVRMRFCTENGELEFKNKRPPTEKISKFQPWFSHTQRKNTNVEIFFGHWSTLGIMDDYHTHATDTGCLWGGKLTAYCIETKQRHTFNCPQNCKINME